MCSANTQSSLFQTLSPEQLSDVIGAHFPGSRILESSLMSGGLFNTTYRVDLDDGQRLVLRLGPVNRHLLMVFEEGMMQAEKYVYDLCRPLGIPVQNVRAVNTSRAVVDRDYMIVDYIDSVTLDRYPASPEDARRLHAEVNALARRIHGITGASFGRVSDQLRGSGSSTWREAIQVEIENWMLRSAPTNLFPAEMLNGIDAAFRRIAPLLDEIETPSLVHADLWAGNILVDGSGEIAAIIDADRAIFGDPDFEYGLISPLISYTGEETPARSLRIQFYRLIVMLLDSYVWMCQYNNPAQHERTKQLAMEQLERLSHDLRL